MSSSSVPRVQVGEPGAYIINSDQEEDAFVSKIGGLSKWLESPPHSSLLVCTSCKTGPMALLTQIYAPVSPDYERTLYVHACINAGCENPSIRCLSFQSPTKGSELQKTEVVQPVAQSENSSLTSSDIKRSMSTLNSAMDKLNHSFKNLVGTNTSIEKNKVGPSGNDEKVVDGFAASAEDMDWGDDDDDDLEDMEAASKPETFDTEVLKAKGSEEKKNQVMCLESTNDGNTSAAGQKIWEQKDLASLLAKRDEISQDIKNRDEKVSETKINNTSEAKVDNNLSACSTQVQKNIAKKRKGKEGKLGNHFKPFYIVFETEHEKEKYIPTKEDRDRMDALQRLEAKADIKNEEWAGEKYESVSKADKPLRRFLKRIQRHPGQVVRYCYGTEPLLISSRKPPRHVCRECKSEKRIELQIMPGLISVLDRDTGLDWGTINIFVCPNMCGSIKKFSVEDLYTEAPV